MVDSASAINQLRGNLFEAEYAEWRNSHKEYKKQCVIDIDQIEYRGDKPVAVIDLKTWPRYETPKYWEVVKERSDNFSTAQHIKIAQLLGCRAYYVFPNISGDVVMVLPLGTESDWHRTTLEGYKNWLLNLQ